MSHYNFITTCKALDIVGIILFTVVGLTLLPIMGLGLILIFR